MVTVNLIFFIVSACRWATHPLEVSRGWRRRNVFSCCYDHQAGQAHEHLLSSRGNPWPSFFVRRSTHLRRHNSWANENGRRWRHRCLRKVGRTRWYQLFLPALKLGKVFQRRPKSIVQLESIPWHCKRLRAVLYKFPKKLRPHSKKTINIYHNHTWVFLEKIAQLSPFLY